MDNFQKILEWLSALPLIGKIMISIVLIGIALFILVMMWQDPKKGYSPQNQKSWTENKSLDGLNYTLIRLSRTNKNIINSILNSGNDGLYINELADRLQLSEKDVHSRMKTLTELELIETLQLTRPNYRINEDVYLIIKNDKKLLKQMLK